MNANAMMRLVATVAFVLAIFGVAPAGIPMVPFGLALWCGSTLVP
jgi:hypothetical protein